MLRTPWLIAACLALLAQTPVAAHDDRERDHDDRSRVERHTRFGKVVGVDNSATNGTYAWKGVPFAKPPTGALRWKAPVDPDRWKRPKATQEFGNACVQYGRIYGPGANNRHDADDRHHAGPGGGQRGLPVPEHLAAGEPP